MSYKLLCVLDVKNAFNHSSAQVALDNFRESVQPSAEFGITITENQPLIDKEQLRSLLKELRDQRMQLSEMQRNLARIIGELTDSQSVVKEES